jgi:site-specific DNA recombinase
MQKQSKAIILARVSSKSQEEEGYSLDSQLKLLRDYCNRKGLTIIKEFKITESASKQDRRKVFQELMKFIIKQKISHFVVEKTDRLTRNFKDAVSMDDWLEGNDQRMLHLVKENLELHRGSKSDTKFMLNIYVAFAKKFIDNLREEAMKGWAEKLAQGWLPSPPPPGYMTITENSKRIHVPNPNTDKLMRRVFKLYTLPDHTGKTITKVMSEMGIATSKGRPYAKSHVYNILSNPFYIGINRFNGKEYPGAQEPIISKALFREVQVKLHRKSSAKYQKHNPVYRGMLRCSNCQSMITWQIQKGNWYGACQRKIDECKGHRLLRQDRLENIIVGTLGGIVDQGDKILKRLEKSLEESRPQYIGIYRDHVVEALTRQLGRMRRIDNALYEDKLAGDISVIKYNEKHQQFSEQIADINERLNRLDEEQKDQLPEEIAYEKSDNPLVNLYLKSLADQKRIILANLFKKMVANGDNVSLELT